MDFVWFEVVNEPAFADGDRAMFVQNFSNCIFRDIGQTKCCVAGCILHGDGEKPGRISVPPFHNSNQGAARPNHSPAIGAVEDWRQRMDLSVDGCDCFEHFGILQQCRFLKRGLELVNEVDQAA